MCFLIDRGDSWLISPHSDPPRPESHDAVMDALRAGIVVRMLTGDHVRAVDGLVSYH